MDESIRDTRRSGFRTAILVALVPVFVGVGILLQAGGQEKIREVRTLERIPLTSVIASLPGPTELTGRALSPAGATLLDSHWTGTPCIWYRAVKEVETRDSEGNTSWSVVFSESRGIPFELEDATGSIGVSPDPRVSYLLERDWRRTEGDERFSEYRIETEDVLNIVGIRARDSDRITFPESGAYLPIISDRPLVEARSSRAILSTILVIASVLSIAYACSSGLLALRLYNTLGFAIVVGSMTGISLVAGGAVMMHEDLVESHRSVMEQFEVADRIAAGGFDELGIEWDGEWRDPSAFAQAATSVAPGPRIAAIRMTLAARVARSRTIRDRFPQNVIAALCDLPPLPVILGEGEVVPDDGDVITPARPFWLVPLLATAGAILVTLICSLIGFRKVRTKRLIENIPTTPASAVEIGVCELAGTVEALAEPPPLHGPLTGSPCVWYRHLVQEWRGSGKNRRLHTISDETEHQRFLCRDESGAVPVDIAEARVVTGRCAKKSRGRRVYSEYSLREQDPLYILGSAELDATTGDSLMIGKDPQGLPFIVSNLPEHRIKGKEITVAFWLLATGIGTSAAIIMGSLLFSGRLAAVDQMIAALVSTGLLALLVCVIMYNDLVFLRQRVDWARSNIDVALRKRADLLPRLEKVTRAYLEHEAEVQPILAELRTAWRNPDHGVEEAGGSVVASRSAIDRLMAVRERYPDLKADTVTERLMREIAVLENRIAASRAGYNAAVRRYLARTHSVPELLIAGTFGFRDRPLLSWDVGMLELQSLDFRDDPEDGNEDATSTG